MCIYFTFCQPLCIIRTPYHCITTTTSGLGQSKRLMTAPIGYTGSGVMFPHVKIIPMISSQWGSQTLIKFFSQNIHETAAADSELCCSSPHQDQKRGSHHSSSGVLYTGFLTVKGRILKYYCFKALNGLGPKYISGLRWHRLGKACFLSPRSKLDTERSPFSFYAPYIWNKLQAESLSSFKSRLKTFLFATSFY